MRLWIDLETYCETPIEHGTHKYAESDEILLISWAIDDEPAAVVDVANGEPAPARLVSALNDPSVEIWAHNSHFDRTTLKKYFPAVSSPTRWRDTLILAYSYSLPGALSDLCGLLKLPVDKAKDKDGRALVLLFSKPRPASCKIRRATKETHPEEWARFVNYARLDVEAMREVYNRLPKWNDTPELWREWHLDQAINDRGMCIDTELVTAAVKASATAKDLCDETIRTLTGGQVQTVGQCTELIKFMLKEYGYTLPDMQKATLERRLNDSSLPAPVRDIIAARLAASKASVKKFEALQNAVNKDGRLRGCLQFYGATRTGRWSGRLFQPKNLPRGTMKPDEVEAGISALKSGTAEYLYDDINALVSNCVRGAIVAPKGRKLCVADLSNIEGRVLAWLAGEDWKIKAFRDFDAGHGVDLYKAAYGRTFGVDPKAVTKSQRQIGKVLELSMGYAGGAGAFLTFAKGFNTDLDALARHTSESIDKDILKDAEDTYQWYKERGLTEGESKEVFTACEAIKRAWRKAHPAIVKFWGDVDKAAISLLTGERQAVTVGKVQLTLDSGYIRVRLPSGRLMCYPASRLATDEERATFCYWGQFQASKAYGYVRTYSGKVVENITQAVARDVLASSMHAIEQAGYKIVLSVHDELITETPDTEEYSSGKLSELMATAPEWAEGLPLAAAGFESYRYKKD